jgi:hypothetical protein
VSLNELLENASCLTALPPQRGGCGGKPGRLTPAPPSGEPHGAPSRSSCAPALWPRGEEARGPPHLTAQPPYLLDRGCVIEPEPSGTTRLGQSAHCPLTSPQTHSPFTTLRSTIADQEHRIKKYRGSLIACLDSGNNTRNTHPHGLQPSHGAYEADVPSGLIWSARSALVSCAA